VIARNHDDTGNGYGTESGGIKCTPDWAAVPHVDVGDAPAISAIKSAMRQHNYYYKLSVRGWSHDIAPTTDQHTAGTAGVTDANGRATVEWNR
jgi:hypothetical protein